MANRDIKQVYTVSPTTTERLKYEVDRLAGTS